MMGLKSSRSISPPGLPSRNDNSMSDADLLALMQAGIRETRSTNTQTLDVLRETYDLIKKVEAMTGALYRTIRKQE